jgi:ABC-type multidrug transport system fused ATPase/permease subunit
MRSEPAPARPSRSGLLLRLWRQLPPARRRQFLGVALLTLFGAVAEVITLGAVLPFLAFIADPGSLARYPAAARLMQALPLGDGSRPLLGLALMFTGAAVAAAVVRLWLAWISNRFVFLVAHDLGLSVYDRALHQPYGVHLSRSSSDVHAAIAKIDLLSQTLLISVMQAMSAVIIGLFIVAALLAVDPLVSTLAIGGFAVLYLAISRVSLRGLRGHGRTIAGVQSHRIRAVQEGLGGIRDVLLDGTQPVFLGKFARLDDDLRQAQARSTFIAAAPRFIIEAAGMILIVALAVLLGARGEGLAAVLPVLGVLALGAQRLLPLAQFVYVAWARLAANRETMADVLAMLEAAKPEDAGSPVEPVRFEDRIEFQGVSLRYAGRDRPAVDGLSFAIPKGCRLGLVGRSGSGKSTTIDVLMGLLEPSTGRLLVDGRPLDARSRRGWQRQVAHVPQEIFLADACFL